MFALRYLGGLFALALALFLTAQLGLLFTVEGTSIALLWPPAGIAMAVLFRGGVRFWPGVFAGMMACEWQFFPWWAVLGIAAGSTSGVVVAVAILQRFRFDPWAGGRRELYTFLLAGLVGMTVSASNSLIWQAAAGLPNEGLVAAWLFWWLGDTAGFLIVGPPLLTAAWPDRRQSLIRPAVGLLVTAALSCLAFTDLIPTSVHTLLVFPPFMMLVWIGMTERLRVGSLHVLVLVVFAVAGTATGEGAFGSLAPIPKMLTLWALITTAAFIVLAMTTTLAERVCAEVALAASVADYQALVDSTPAAIVRYTADGTLTFVNETLCKLLGRPRATLIGESVLELIPNMPRSEVVADLPLTRPVSGPADGASGLIRKSDGSCRWYRWTARRITTADGQTEFQAVGIDLTERRQAESDRAAIERKMQDAQRLEALGVLAGGVAHDFNNLLAGVLGHAELAIGELPDGHPARDHLTTVLSGIAQAGGLTRQLLAYSGKGRFLLRSLNLNELIVQTTDLLRVTLPKKVQLDLALTENLPFITGDDGQLRQVLMNLIINAGEAIGDKPGTVTVTTTGHDLEMDAVSGGVYSPSAPGRFIELIVSDTGCGMDEATRAKLFDPFFSTKFAGRGLGLSAVLGIIRGHGGGIRVDSEPGVGTRFTVLLPASTEAALPSISARTPPPTTATLPSATIATPSNTRHARRSGTVPMPPSRPQTPPDTRPQNETSTNAKSQGRGLAIVADDEPTVRQVGELMLKQLGFEVLTATNGQEALACFEANANRVTLVLLDLMMPVMDGPEALAVIRERSAVPVILCSGYTAEAVPEELASDTITSFLQKPYARADLQNALTALGV